jgi:hypothetical protein
LVPFVEVGFSRHSHSLLLGPGSVVLFMVTFLSGTVLPMLLIFFRVVDLLLCEVAEVLVGLSDLYEGFMLIFLLFLGLGLPVFSAGIRVQFFDEFVVFYLYGFFVGGCG